MLWRFYVMSKSHIKFQNVTYAIQSDSIISDLSFEIKQGEFCVIKGPSGSGKSTILSLMGGLLTPSNGQVYILDIDIYALNDSKRSQFINSQIGFIFQDFQLINRLTVLENICLPLQLQNQLFFGSKHKHIKDDAHEYLSMVGLSNKADALPSVLSRGEKQRVALCRALITKPALILCDEPTGNR